jgi:hypothetical protein
VLIYLTSSFLVYELVPILNNIGNPVVFQVPTAATMRSTRTVSVQISDSPAHTFNLSPPSSVSKGKPSKEASEAGCIWFLLRLLFCPADGGSMNLRNVGLQSGRRTLHVFLESACQSKCQLDRQVYDPCGGSPHTLLLLPVLTIPPPSGTKFSCRFNAQAIGSKPLKQQIKISPCQIHIDIYRSLTIDPILKPGRLAALHILNCQFPMNINC